MKSIYIVATPYHLLLACTIASYMDENEEKMLVVSPHFADEKKIVGPVERWDRNPFGNVEQLNPRTDYGTFNKIAASRKNIGKLRKIIGKEKFETFIFNIEQPEGQFVAYLNRRNGGRNYYGEDGIGSYIRRDIRDPMHLRLLKRLLYGGWFQRVVNHLEFDFDRAYLVRPEFAESEMELVKIPGEAFRKLNDDGLIPEMNREFGIDISGVDAILVLPHFEIGSKVDFEKVKDVYRRIIGKYEKAGKTVALKYHPREKTEWLDNNAKIIPKSAPSEIIFFNMKKGQQIIGDLTGALCTAKMINEGIRSVSIMRILGYENERFEKLFRKWGVEMPDSVEEIS